MTNITLLATVGTVILSLVIPASMYSDKDFTSYLYGVASLLLIILGVTLLGSPLQYSTGTEVTTTSTGYDITNLTQEMPATFNTPIGLIFATGGLAGVFASFRRHRSLKQALENDGYEQLGTIDR